MKKESNFHLVKQIVLLLIVICATTHIDAQNKPESKMGEEEQLFYPPFELETETNWAQKERAQGREWAREESFKRYFETKQVEYPEYNSPEPTLKSAAAVTAINESDSLALVALYNATNGPGWTNNTNWLTGPVNNWYGIIIENGRVTRINLENNGLIGIIPSEIGNLTNLQFLFAGNNQLSGSIPSELGNLTNLAALFLYNNQLSGSIPAEIGNLTKLQHLSLPYNQLSGNIPAEIGNLRNLIFLYLWGNQLSGSIPTELGNLSTLQYLILGGNQLTGSIPVKLGQLSELFRLDISWNQLSGSIPAELGNLSNLQELYLMGNQLNGNFPHELANCSSLNYLFIGYNSISGVLPAALCNLPLQVVNFEDNLFDEQSCPAIRCLLDMGVIFDGTPKQPQQSGFQLVGQCQVFPPIAVQDSLALVALYNATNGPGWSNNANWLTGPVGSWYGVTVTGDRVVELNLSGSWNNPFGLTGSLPAEIGNLTALEILNLSYNNVTGFIPAEIGNLTNLREFRFVRCQMEGSLPQEFGNLVNLQYLTLYDNNLSGEIPSSIGNLQQLGILELTYNILSGNIPLEIYELSSLSHLILGGNNLEGSIHPNISKLTNLSGLGLFSNDLSGTIPPEIGQLLNLYSLNLSFNQLSGTIPTELGNLISLEFLDLFNNQLTGLIPMELNQLTGLYSLDLSSNQLTGSIPVELGSLTNLRNLYLQRNQLTGTIPPEIVQLSNLQRLYLFENQLTGTIPAEIFQNLQAGYFQNNQFDHLPEILTSPNLYQLVIQNNNLTFEDLEYNMDIAMVQSPWGADPYFNYIPQKKTGHAETILLQPGDNYTLDISCGGTQNSYQWYKNGLPVSSPSSTSSLTIENADDTHTGTYFCRVTNSLVPGLTIESEPVIVELDYPKDEIFRSLVITEARLDNQNNAFVELTNMGDMAINLNKFKFGTIRPWSQPIYDVWNDPWVPEGNRYFMLPDYVLYPGESYVMTTAYDFGPRQYNNRVEGFEDTQRPKQTDIYDLADFLVHVREPKSSSYPWVKDSVTTSTQFGDNYQWVFDVWDGRECFYIEQKLSPVDSVVIDQVGGVFDNDGRNFAIASDVAGIMGATFSRILLRKFSVKTGNLDFASGRGVGPDDSEWIPVPRTDNPWRDVFWTIGNHGLYVLDENTLESDVIDVDFSNSTLTVPWGTRRLDDIMRKMVKKPGLSWIYRLSHVKEDSLFRSAKTGDMLTVLVHGNTLQSKTFNILVNAPLPSDNLVIPVDHKNPNGPITDRTQAGILDWPRVTTHDSGIDTITGTWHGLPYATRIDTLLKYLEKPANASWEILYGDGILRADLKNGDKLKVTAQNGAVKEYYIQVQPYNPSHNAYLASITWPDMPLHHKPYYNELGWNGDTIAGFNATTFNYRMQVPADVQGIPALVAKPQNLNATVEVKRATSLTGTLQDRTISFYVVAEDDSVIFVYNVELVKEKDPDKMQPYYAEPFLSELVFWDQWSNSFGEIANPGNQPLDLSDYMIAMQWDTNPASVILSRTGTDEWLDRYDKYVPGYKWVSEAQWAVTPGMLQQDLDVNPIVQPGDVFCFGSIHTDAFAFPSWLPDYVWPVPAQLDVQFNNYDGIKSYRNPWGENISSNGTPIKKWSNSNWYMFKILNDSIKMGLKPAVDPNDFVLIETWGMSDGFDWIIGGQQAQMITNWMRKPHIYKGNTSFSQAGSFGTNPEDTEWTWTNQSYWQARNVGWPLDILNIGNDIGQHFIYEPSHYKSTVTSVVYKVSEGYSMSEEVRGIISGTTVGTFLSNLIKADENQSLKVMSGDTELGMDDLLSLNDVLIVLSADNSNTTRYFLNVGEGLSSNAVLTSVYYNIFVTDETGTITGFGYETTLRNLLEDINVPEGASLAVIDVNGNPVPLQKLNFNNEYFDVKVTDQIYLEVVAEDGETRILYQLIPESDTSDLFILSDYFEVNEEFNWVLNVPPGISVSTLVSQLYPSPGANIIISDKFGFQRTDGLIAEDDLITVTSGDGSESKNYNIVMLGQDPPDTCPQHFYPAWIGNGYDQMNLNILSAQLDGMDLQPGDEIGIFDGDLCVGYGKVAQTVSLDNVLVVVVSRDDGTENGYITGNNISYKFWSCSASAESPVQSALYFNNLLQPVDEPTFNAGATAFVELYGTSQTEISMNLHFNSGWNLFSAPVHSKTSDIKTLFQPLIDNNSLVKIQDEQGNAVEDWGFIGGWKNFIGDIHPTEGYKIKVNFDDVLEITGEPVEYPFAIPLSSGWNIMGYPQTSPFDAMKILQPLINNGTLQKVQDEAGNAIEDWGFLGGWKNFIGDFVPGEGYKIKLSAPETVWIQESYPKSAVARNQTVATAHFLPEFVNNGVDHMNINIGGLPLNILQSGDELAVFDGNVCVGAVTLLPWHLNSGTVSIPVSAADDFGMPGFIEGNVFTLKLWSTKQLQEHELEPEILKGPGFFVKHESALLSLEKYATTGLDVDLFAGKTEINCYPNPFSDEVTIEINLAEDAEVQVEILNQLGQMVRTIMSPIYLNQGLHRLNWNGLTDNSKQVVSGIYHLRIRIDDSVIRQKIVLSK